MKKKLIASVLAGSLVLTCFSGCSLLNTDYQRDLSQVVAEVNIAKSDDFKEGGEYKDYASVIEDRSSNGIIKRDLVAYFINYGYSNYVSKGYTYKKAFDVMTQNLCNREIIIQYAMVYFFDNYKTEYNINSYNTFVNNALEKETKTDKDLVKSIAQLEYFLDDEEEAKAVYDLYVSVNSTIDNYEKKYIDAEETENTVEARTTPTGLDTANDKYYDKDYKIYTGLNAVDTCGSYEKQKDSTPLTRKNGYHAFLKSLSDNYMVSSEEDTSNFKELNYYSVEYKSQLESALVDKLAKTLEDEAKSKVSNNEEYLKKTYDEMYATQQSKYSKDSSAFTSSLDSVSDSSFVLYAPEDGYGFVYNILVPFSTQQSQYLEQSKGDNSLTQEKKYAERAKVLADVEAIDQRDTWFTGKTDYSYQVGQNSETDAYKALTANTDYYGNSNYLFFENSIQKGGYDAQGNKKKYKALTNYSGLYAYNGQVDYDEDEEKYTLTPNKLGINDFIHEVENYMNFSLTKATGISKEWTTGSLDSNYATQENQYVKDANNEYDYSKFVYYSGKVNFTNPTDNNTILQRDSWSEDKSVHTKASEQNVAMSAFNELMFAYSTDTGCLNKYLGYSISKYKTSYMAEFEYGAKQAMKEGVGAYTVVPTDYGWHIIYCSFIYNQGNVYSFNWDDVTNQAEGSFTYNFYQLYLNNIVNSVANSLETTYINKYSNDTCVTKYADRYSDYSSLDKSNKKKDDDTSSSGQTQTSPQTTPQTNNGTSIG